MQFSTTRFATLAKVRDVNVRPPVYAGALAWLARLLRLSTLVSLSQVRSTDPPTSVFLLINSHISISQTKSCFFNAAVLDADNVDLIAAQFAQQVEKLVQVRG